MLQLSYSPRISTTILVDRRWGTDIYHCEPASHYDAGCLNPQGRRWECQGGYGTANMCAATGRTSAPGWGWDYTRLAYSRGLRPLAAVIASLRVRLAPKPTSLPDLGRVLAAQQRAAIEASIASASYDAAGRRTVDDLLRLPEGRKACRACAKAGKAYSTEAEYFGRRPVVRAAVARLAARAARQADRLVAESARSQPAGRMVARLVELRAARAEQLRKNIERAVLTSACGLYRIAKAGDHTACVTLGDRPSASGDSSKGERYSSRCTFRKTNSHHSYVVRETWEQDVYDRDLEVVDGMLTLDAEPIQGHGPELYRATWVEQGRGMSLVTVRGYIARDPATSKTYHAPSARAALDGLARKLGQRAPRRRPTLNLDRACRRWGGVVVTWADSAAVGNCDSGTRSWCRAVGIDPDADADASLREVIAGYRLRPLPEALAVIRRVVRTAKSRAELGSRPGDPGTRVVFTSEGGFRVVRDGKE